MGDSVRFWGLVPAAGTGSRMGAAVPKQYLEIAGATVLDHTLDKLNCLSWLSGIVVSLHPEDSRWQHSRWAGHDRVKTCHGGNERVDSVYQGLLSLAPWVAPDDWVLVHDVARPCVSLVDIQNLKSRLEGLSVGGILGAEISDTLKRVDSDGAVAETVDRKGVWAALTPQMFRYRILRYSIELALQRGLPVTDEASAVELAGYPVRMVRGSRRNIKITTPEDLALAEFFLTSEKPVR